MKMNKTNLPVEAALSNVRHVQDIISVQNADLVTFLMKKKGHAVVQAQIWSLKVKVALLMNLVNQVPIIMD